MNPFVDNIFGGLFSAVDPLGMILRTLMTLLSDSLAQLTAGMYAQLFQITTVDFSTDAVGSIWRITTGLSVGLATILLIMAAFRSMLAQSNSHLLQAFPGVVLAILGPQAAALLLPMLSAGFTSLAESIVQTATPDLAQSMRLLAGVGSNPIYEGLGLMAPLIAAMLLFGMSAVFFVLLFCMAGAVVLFVLSPFAFAGFVMAPTRVWFKKWATAMFALLFAKVPIAILLALSVSLFANSQHASTAQSYVNAGAGLILGMGALLSPMLAYGLFSFMGTMATRPSGVPGSPSRAASSGYYGMQMGRAGVNSTRSAVNKLRSPGGGTTGSDSNGGAAGPTPGPHEPSATQRAAGAQVGPASGGVPLPVGATVPPAPVGASTATSAASGSAAAAGAAGGVGASTAGTAAAAGAATAGVGAVVVAGAAVAKQAGDKAASQVKSTAEGLTSSATDPPASPSAFGSADDHRVD